eukprot:1158556-Pelagomonas_calceolata.AAC.11
MFWRTPSPLPRASSPQWNPRSKQNTLTGRITYLVGDVPEQHGIDVTEGGQQATSSDLASQTGFPPFQQASQVHRLCQASAVAGP